MKPSACHLFDAQREAQRQQYCGTCKTLGRLYGHRARLLLNYDTAFLAELLTLLAGAEQLPCAPAYQSFNCFVLPTQAEEMPIVWQYAATANLVLTEFKLADQVADRNAIHWRWAQRLFAKRFVEATAWLAKVSFPVAELASLSHAQAALEASIEETREPEARLERLAAPTAQATALFFRHGARLIGRSELADLCGSLGQAFGRLVYVLDAFEDYVEDEQTSQFNAWRAAYDWHTERFTSAQRQQALQGICALREQIEATLKTLPLPAQAAAAFCERLRVNLSRRTGQSLPVLVSRSSLPRACSLQSLTWQERWQGALTAGRQLWQREGVTDSAVWWLRAALAFGLVLLVAFLLPNWAARLKSSRDGLSLAMNLMFLGALPGALGSVVTALHKKPKVERQPGSCEENCGCCETGCDCGCEVCGEHCSGSCDRGCGDCHCCSCCDGGN